MSKPKAKTPCKNCLQTAWEALKMALQSEDQNTQKIGGIYCRHTKTMAMYVHNVGAEPTLQMTVGLTEQEATVAFTRIDIANEGTVDFIQPARKEGMH